MNPSDAAAKGLSGNKLKRVHSPVQSELVVGFFAAVLFGTPAFALGGPIVGLNTSITVFSLLALQGFDIPPYRLAPRVRWFVFGVSVVGVVGLTWRYYGSWSVLLTFCLMVLCWAFAGVYSVIIAREQFYKLQEIQPAGPNMFRPINGAPLVTHVTDVHVTQADDVGTVEDNSESGSDAFAAWLARAASEKTRFLVISGDLTDTGAPAEWSRVNAATQAARLNDQFVVVAPGNHDLFAGYSSSPHNRLRPYFDYLCRFCPELTTTGPARITELEAQAIHDTEPHIASTAEDLKLKHRQALTQWYKVGDSQRPLSAFERREIEKDIASTDWRERAREKLLNDWFDRGWYDIFPLMLHDADTGTFVVVINSVLQGAGTLGESALGKYGDAQLARLKQALSSLPHGVRTVLVVTHHAPLRAPGDWRLLVPWAASGLKRTKARIQEFCYLGHTVDEARQFLGLLCDLAGAKQDVRFLLFCGHRHSPAIGWAGPVLILEGNALAGRDPSELLIQANPSVSICKRSLSP